MKNIRLIVGGYNCLRAVNCFINQEGTKGDKLLINVSLLNRIQRMSNKKAIDLLHKRGQIVTLGYDLSSADIIMDNDVIRHYGEANSQIIDSSKYMTLFPSSAKVEKRRSLAGITVNAYRNIPELLDIAVAYELHADSIVYFDMKYLTTLFSNEISRKTGIQISRKSLENEVWKDDQGSFSIKKERLRISGCEGVYDYLVKKYINTSNFDVILITTGTAVS